LVTVTLTFFCAAFARAGFVRTALGFVRAGFVRVTGAIWAAAVAC
jgi:hypothetical protein